MLINNRPKSTPIVNHIVIELVVIVLTTSLPMIAAFELGGGETLQQVMSSMVPVVHLVWWSIGITAVAIFVNFLNRAIYKKTDVGAKIWNWLSAIADEVAPGIQSLLRVIAGVMVTFVLLWWVHDNPTFEMETARYLLAMGAVAFLEAIAIRYVVECMEIKHPRKAAER